MSTIAVVYYHGATLKSRSVVTSVIADLRDEGHTVHLLDISGYTTVSQDFPPQWIARMLGHRVFRERFDSFLQERDVTHHHLGQNRALPSTLTPGQQEECNVAIESELLTYFRRDSLTYSHWFVSSLRGELTRQTTASYAAVVGALTELAPDTVLIPNGRTSRQKAARLAAESLGIVTHFYEDGRARKGSYYLGNTQPHDRLASQAEIENFLAKVSSREVSALASAWIEERTSVGSGTNSFSARWAAPSGLLGDKKQGTKPHAVFFTSSADEFLAFGPMWHIDSWTSQFEAFDLAMTVLEKMGAAMTLRVHPNLTSKSRKYFLKTVKAIRSLEQRHPRLEVLWHTSSANSYDLAAKADWVIAERSTIGLEANLMGKPVWVNQASQWDQIADVRQMLKPEDVTEPHLTRWEVDPSGAERFVAYWMLQERPLRHHWDTWSSWDPENPPLRMRIANLAVKNSWRHRLHLIAVERDRWLNALFRFRHH